MGRMSNDFMAALERESHKRWFWMLPETPAISEFSLSRVTPGQLRIEHIYRYVGCYYNVTYTDLISARRTGRLMKPRHVAAYLAQTVTTKSLPEIGRAANNRNHTTILNSVRRTRAMMAGDVTLAEEVRELEDALRAKVTA